MSAAAIEFRNVSKVYKRIFSEERMEALSDVSFEVNAGEVCAFLGPNGAGKTTSISILMGFQFANSGRFACWATSPAMFAPSSTSASCPRISPSTDTSPGPNFCACTARSPAEAVRPASAIADLLAKVKLTGYENLKIGKYSRGMVQRLGIAQALLCDPQPRDSRRAHIGARSGGAQRGAATARRSESRGKTVFLSSHILPEVEQICDRVIIIDRGKVVRTGRLNEMLARRRRVDIVADRLPAEMEQAWAQRGATFDRGPHGVRITRRLRETRTGGRPVGGRLRRGQHESGPQHTRRVVPQDRGQEGGGSMNESPRHCLEHFPRAAAQQGHHPVPGRFRLRAAVDDDAAAAGSRNTRRSRRNRCRASCCRSSAASWAW